MTRKRYAMKTQAELDAAVIEAIDAYVGEDYKPGMWNAVVGAVLARREARRPHKAAVLLYLCANNLHSRPTDADVKKWWKESACKDKARAHLAELLAAPDEPTS
jgi:hypothetical protein